MPITITSREFNQHASKVLKMAEKEPVFITKWGKIVRVVSNYVDYKQHTTVEPSFEELFASSTDESVSDEFWQDFEQTLTKIRKSNKSEQIDFGDE
ncbi:type II toxin-antitoxin system Phd/YefM family antitoxin [Actinobacillus pleuropneumoniae]|uniref:type II toxin-antitoxin system Phd/YefM family antitoxin n=1 Tax=Actinobacillus pleuropneumoniae TaxID=715 RepID=UPI003B022FE4